MLGFPAQPPPMLKAYKDFTHWSSAMKAYLIGGFFWPYVEGVGYGAEPAEPGTGATAAERHQHVATKAHFTCNNITGMELLFQALGEDASAGYRELGTLKAAWNKLHDDRKKGDSRKLVEAVHLLTHTPFVDGAEMEWFGKLEKAAAQLHKCLGFNTCGDCKTAGRTAKLEELFGALVLFKLPEKFALQKTLLQRGEEKDLVLSNVKREVLLALSDASTQTKLTDSAGGSAGAGAFAATRPRGGGTSSTPNPRDKGKEQQKEKGLRKSCDFCKKPNHTVDRCWKKKEAEYYKTHGTDKFYDPRAEDKAHAAPSANDDLDEQYSAMLSIPVESGSFSSEYTRVSVAREVKALKQKGLINAALARKVLALSAQDLTALQAKPSLILDTGAALHLIGHTRAYKTYRELKEPIPINGFGTDMTANAIGIGSITICPQSRTSSRRALTVADVHHVPKMPIGLLSAAVLLDCGYELIVKKGHIDILHGGQYVGTAQRRGNLFFVDVEEYPNGHFPTAMHSSPPKSPTETDLLHFRFAHRNLPDLLHMAQHKLVAGMPPLPKADKAPVTSPCEPCLQGKMHRLPFPKQSSKDSHTHRPLELVHLDLVGPIQQVTKGQCKYFLTIVDDFTRRAGIQLLPDKSSETVYQAFMTWLTRMENETGRILGGIRTDRGKEFFNKTFKAMLQSKGARHEAGPPHTPQQNGVAERMNRTLLNMTRCMLHAAGLHLSWWGDALIHAVYIHNRTLQGRLSPPQTPMEAWTGKPPNVGLLRVFGCKAHVLIQAEDRTKSDKFADLRQPCIHLGVEPDTKSWRFFCLSTGKFIVSRDAVFDEASILRGQRAFTLPHPEVAPIPASAMQPLIDEFWAPSLPSVLPPALPSSPEGPAGGAVSEGESVPDSSLRNASDSVTADTDPIREWRDRAPPLRGEDLQLSPAESRVSASPPQGESLQTTDLDVLRQETARVDMRLREQGELLEESRRRSDRVAGRAPSFDGTTLPPQRRPVRRPTSTEDYMDNDHALAAVRPPMPETYNEAVSHPESSLWWAAMDKEYQAFVDTGTFTLVPPPAGKSVVKCRWVYDEKLDAFGNLQRRKARLVAKGYTQRQGVDYDEIFAPTGNKSTLRVLLHVAAAKDMEIEMMDFDNAFLNGDLEEEVYMQQPAGYEDKDNPNWVWKLHKPVYGLKQAPRQWYKKLRETLVGMGFEQCVKEPALFRKDGIWLYIYVDDMVIFSSGTEILEEFKKAVMTRFKMKELGPIHHYLKIRIVRDRPNRHIYLLQETFVKRILERFKMGECKPWSTPLPVNHKLSARDKDEAASEEPYASLVGAVNYCCTGTRPDISFSNGLLARYMAVGAHTERHWRMGKRILRYLQGTKDLALRLGGKTIQLTGWSDSSFADCLDTSRSTLGWCFSLGDGVVSWSAKRSAAVADSTTVAEYYALNAAAKEAIFLRDLMSFLRLELQGATPIFCDSSGARGVATNPGSFHPRMKHLRVADHQVQQYVDAGEVAIHTIDTESNVADVFTKALPRDRH